MENKQMKNVTKRKLIAVTLGTYQLILNVALFVFQLLWGRSYIGLGMIINLFLLGYIVQFGTWVLDTIFGVGIVLTLPQQLVIMAAALIILTFGLAMYQVAELGVAPYDFVALGLAEKLPVPYFVLRVGTVITAFFLGPLVAYFSKLHQKWVR